MVPEATLRHRPALESAAIERFAAGTLAEREPAN